MTRYDVLGIQVQYPNKVNRVPHQIVVDAETKAAKSWHETMSYGKEPWTAQVAPLLTLSVDFKPNSCTHSWTQEALARARALGYDGGTIDYFSPEEGCGMASPGWYPSGNCDNGADDCADAICHERGHEHGLGHSTGWVSDTLIVDPSKIPAKVYKHDYGGHGPMANRGCSLLSGPQAWALHYIAGIEAPLGKPTHIPLLNEGGTVTITRNHGDRWFISRRLSPKGTWRLEIDYAKRGKEGDPWALVKIAGYVPDVPGSKPLTIYDAEGKQFDIRADGSVLRTQ